MVFINSEKQSMFNRLLIIHKFYKSELIENFVYRNIVSHILFKTFNASFSFNFNDVVFIKMANTLGISLHYTFETQWRNIQK